MGVLRWADRIADTTSAPGTGNVTTAGSPPTTFFGFASVPSIAIGDTFYYTICDVSGANVEGGLGTVVTVSPFVFSRTAGSVLFGSAGAGALVNFSSGTQNVWLDAPAGLFDGTASHTSALFGGLVKFGGSTSSFPALKNSGATLQTRLADDSGDAVLSCAYVSVTTPNSPYYLLYKDATRYISSPGPSILQIGATGISIDANNSLINLLSLNFQSSFAATGSNTNVILKTDAAGILAQRNGTSGAQTFRVYNTYTDATHNECGVLDWTTSANVFTIGTQQVGAVARNLQFVVGGASKADYGITAANSWFIATSLTTAGSIFSQDDVSANAVKYIYWQARTLMSSPADGVLLISNNGATDFNRLQFGGTTSSFPALKRSSTTLAVRLADDSADAPLSCASITLTATSTPSSASDTGTTGQIKWDASYVYVCTATNTWKRAAIATW
jgi:hypothetical protein